MNITSFDQLRETLYEETLENGLTVCLLPKPGFQKTYAVFTTRFGSIDNHFRLPGGEDVQVPDGIAHFLEHKMFDKKDRDVFREFSRNGASYNAFTTFNRTAYLFSSTGNVEANLNLLLDFVQEPYFSDESVEKEKGIIGQEIRMYDDNPDWKVYMNLLKAMYAHHPVRIEIAGTVESIGRITKETLYRCHETFYHPGNMLLFAVGAFDPEKILRLVQDNQAQKRFGPPPNVERLYPEEPPQLHEPRVEHALPVGLPKCLIGIKDADGGLTGEELLKRELTTRLLLAIVFGVSSSFYQSLYDSELITESFDFDYAGEPGYGYSIVGGDCPDPDRLAEAVRGEVERVRQTGIQPEAFERSKRKEIGAFLRSLNSMEFIANQFTRYRFNGTQLFTILPVLESITLEDVERRLDEHFRTERMAVSVVRSATPQE